jgi:methyl-accepting chemotaxis protein
MRFSTLSILAIVGTSFSRPLLLPRDDTLIKYNINRVGQELTLLEKSLSSRKPRPRDGLDSVRSFFNAALDNHEHLIKEVRDSADDIRRSRAKPTELEASALGVTLLGWESTQSKVVDHWISVKRDAQDVRMVSTVYDSLQRALVEQTAFADAILEKLSGSNKALAKTMKRRVTSNVNKAIKEYRQ